MAKAPNTPSPNDPQSNKGEIPEATEQPKKKRKPIDPNETPRDRFKRVAGIRSGDAIRAIRLLGQMLPGSFEFSEKDITKIETSLKEEITRAIDQMKEGLSATKGREIGSMRRPMLAFED